MPMSNKAVLVGFTLLLVACGRTSLHEEGIVDINVALAPLSGTQVTQDQVNEMLDPFEFQLIHLADKPICTTNSACVWWAEGSLPEGALEKLKGYFDGTLRVVSVERVPSESPAEPLPPR